MWATLALLHVVFWCAAYQVSALVLLPVGLLLATRWMRLEASVWLTTTGTLLLVGWMMPGAMSSAAIMAASVLCLRALRRPTWSEQGIDEARSTAPYRVPRTGEPPRPRPATLSFTRSERESMLRLSIGAFCSLYLSVWTIGWSGGSLPEHVIALDLLLAAATALVIWKARAWSALAPLAAMILHLAIQRRQLTAPASPAQWGVSAVGLGFGLLVASLLVSFRLRKVATSAGDRVPAR
jgi:hypothetical protein